ncbi:MAG: hypothetical protein IJ995_01760 [Clostridia bacterium]|nr:hypothetical protein [Clostridia bacterium]
MEENGSIHAGHRERLRARYREAGLDHFTDHEILELLLGYTILQKDTNTTAHQLIEQFGSLRGVLEAGEEKLERVNLVGPTTAFFLSMIPDITRRYYEQLSEPEIRLMTPEQCITFFLPRFIGRKTECILAAFLDETKRLIDYAPIGQGYNNSVHLHAPTLLNEAKKRGCRYAVLAHNHFTDAVPSLEDISVTRTARATLLSGGIGLLDHVIVCGSTATSMVESGHFNLTKPKLDD